MTAQGLGRLLDRAQPGDVTATLEELSGWHADLRSQFPILVANPDVAYLDSAATAQKPRAVLDAVNGYLCSANANAGRGIYPWANATTARVASALDRVKTFLDDPEPARSTACLVSGASAGLRMVALDWLGPQLTAGDEIVVPHGDHQANLLPWLELQDVLAARGIDVLVHAMPVERGSGDYDVHALAALVNDRTRFVAATHVHHVYGNDMNVHRLRQVVGQDVTICLDAAQGVGHRPLSVRDLDVDVVVFSGHKCMALPGSGAVWARNARGPRLEPGGWAGSPNTTGAVGLHAALDWLDLAGVELVDRWTTALAARLTDGLARLGSYEVLGCQQSLRLESPVQRRCGIVTFRHLGIGAHDLGFILAERGLLVRADGHCQAGGLDATGSGEPAPSVRASFHVYSAVDEVDRLLDALAALDRVGGAR